jgi:hypothetical protein
MSTERPQQLNYLEQYKLFSPQERNTELLGLYQQIPIPLDDYLDKQDFLPNANGIIPAADEQERRDKSETKKVLMKRHRALVSLSHTTRNFQRILSDRFGKLYVYGIKKVDLVITNNFLFQDVGTTPGIFSAAGKNIERDWYKKYVRERLEDNRKYSRLFREQGFEYTEFQDPPIEQIVILRVNPNLAIRNPEEYQKRLNHAIREVKAERSNRRTLPQAFFKLYQEEI